MLLDVDTESASLNNPMLHTTALPNTEHPTPNEQIVEVEDTVLYDGDCRFCCSQVDILRRLDGKRRLKFVSLHDPSVPEKFPDLSFSQLMDQMWIGKLMTNL